MIESDDAQKVAAALSRNLYDVSQDTKNYTRLPDKFWGYYARGHNARGTFCMVVMYSEDSDDIDHVVKMYEDWTRHHSAGVHE